MWLALFLCEYAICGYSADLKYHHSQCRQTVRCKRIIHFTNHLIRNDNQYNLYLVVRRIVWKNSQTKNSFIRLGVLGRSTIRSLHITICKSRHIIIRIRHPLLVDENLRFCMWLFSFEQIKINIIQLFFIFPWINPKRNYSLITFVKLSTPSE